MRQFFAARTRVLLNKQKRSLTLSSRSAAALDKGYQELDDWETSDCSPSEVFSLE